MARRRQHRTFRDAVPAACSHTNKLTRGVVGAVAGGVGGALVGGLVFMVIGIRAMAKIQPPSTGTIIAPFLIPGLGLAGTVAGVLIATKKPEC